MKVTTLISISLITAGAASGQIFNIDLDTSQRGWIDSTGLTDISNGNYIAGSISGTEYRNYFTFDTSGLVGTVQSATLTLDLPDNGFLSPTGSEAFSISGASALSGAISDPSASFIDLGDGPIYGVSIVDGTSTSVSVSLNSSFLNAVNSGAASSVTLGGALLSLAGDSNINEYAFAFSDSNQAANPVRLSLTVDVSGSAVPEPSSAILLTIAAAFGISRRRR